MAIRSKNLNLIPILQTLLKERSVSKAAEALGLSQPAASGALARLREHLDDPLLVRVGRSMQLTPRALSLRKQLDDICSQIDVLFQPEVFDPKSANLRFRIAAPDYLAFLISRALLERLAEETPDVTINFVDVPIDLPRWMEESTIDLAVAGDFGIWPELCSRHLFSDRTVATVAKDHPLAGRTHVTSRDLLAFPSLSLHFDSSCSPFTRFETGIPSLDFSSQITTMSMLSSVLLAVKQPVVARTQASLVEELKELLPLAVIEIVDEEASFDTAMFWAPATDEAPQYKWLRDKVRECFASTDALEPAS